MASLHSAADPSIGTPDQPAPQAGINYSLGRASCALAIFAAILASTTPSPLYPIYIAQWGLQASAGTTIFATYAIGTLLSLFMVGWLDARSSDRRQILLPALALTATGAVLFAMADQVWMLLLGRFLSGFATGLVTSTGSAAVFALSAPDKRHRAATISTIAFTGGAACGPVISSAALATGFAPLVTPFLFIALVATLAFVGLSISAWPRQAPGTPAPAAETGGTSLDDRLRSRLFLLSCLAITTAWMLGSMLMATGVSLAIDLFHLPIHAIAGLLPAIFQLFAGMGQAMFSRLRPLNAILGGAAVLGVVQALTVLGGVTGMAWIFILAMPICGLAYGAAFVGGASLVNATAAPGTLARKISLFYVVGYLSNAIPTFLMGYLIDWYGLSVAYNLFSLLLAGFALAAVGLSLRLRPRLILGTL